MWDPEDLLVNESDWGCLLRKPAGEVVSTGGSSILQVKHNDGYGVDWDLNTGQNCGGRSAAFQAPCGLPLPLCCYQNRAFGEEEGAYAGVYSTGVSLR